MAVGSGKLQRLTAGQEILFGGDRVVRVPPELADAFQPGDQIRVPPHEAHFQ